MAVVDLEAGPIDGAHDVARDAFPLATVDDGTAVVSVRKESCRKASACSTDYAESTPGVPSPCSTACTDNERWKAHSFNTSRRSLDTIHSQHDAAPTTQATAPAEHTIPKKVEKKRLWVLDNAKFFLTMFVALGHTLPHSRTWFNSLFHPSTMTFMMPTYIVISGYTSSPDLTSARKIDGILKLLLSM